MARAHLYRPLQDSAGNLQRGATVRLYRPGTTTLIDNLLFVADEGEQMFTQPLTCPDGFLNVYFQRPVRMRVGVRPFGGGEEVFFDDIDAILLVENATQTSITEIQGLAALNVQEALQELQERKFSLEQGSPPVAAMDVSYDSVGPAPAAGDPPPPPRLLGGANVQAVLEEVDGHLISADARLDTAETRLNGLDAADILLDGRLDTLEAAETVAAHEAELDPHPQYLTQAEGDGLYATPADVAAGASTFQSTSGAGLPALLDRANGDLHYDTTALQEYIRTGLIGAGATDTFNRANAATLGATTSSGAAYTFINAGAETYLIEDNRVRPSQGGAAIALVNVAPGEQIAAIQYTPYNNSQADLLINRSGDGTTYQMAFTVSDPNTTFISIFKNGALFGGAPTGTKAFQSPGTNAYAYDGRTYALEFTRQGSVVTAKATCDVTGEVMALSITDPSPLNGGFAGFRLQLQSGTAPFADNFSASSLGTLAWTSTDQYVGPHTHSQIQAFSSKTASYTLTATDGIVFFTGTDLTATLPTPVGRTGVQYVIKNLDVSNLVVNTAAGLIDATATRTLAQFDTLTVVSDGTNYGVI